MQHPFRGIGSWTKEKSIYCAFEIAAPQRRKRSLFSLVVHRRLPSNTSPATPLSSNRTRSHPPESSALSARSASMKPPPAAKPSTRNSNSNLCFLQGGLSPQDPDIMEVAPSSSWSRSSCQKRKWSQVVPHDIVEINEDDDQDAVVVIDESTSDYKNKQSVGYYKDRQSQVKEYLYKEFLGTSNKNGSGYDTPLGTLNSSEPQSSDFNYPAEDDYEEDEYDEDDYADYESDSDLFEYESNFALAAKFDDLDLPPGVEAYVPWLQNPAPEKPSQKKLKTIVDDEIDRKFKLFKQFDTVQDHSDHHFSKPERLKMGPAVKKPAINWAKRIQHDWKVLEKDLPEKIYVRIYEDRMDLLRAVIIGPDGTPYHDGLFFFDIYFPPSYPNAPPKVHYHSGGLRPNPNLYACGKVCLSLLNTWSGSGCEKWSSSKSTMLQVLVSIQALVLNAKPYFNEPGYARTANTPSGEKQSLDYNERTFLLSCKTMLYSLRRPPKHFEDFVAGHFRKHGRAILVACRAYMDGAQVGCLVGDGVQDVDEGDKSCSPFFRDSLKKLFEDLLMEFTVKGANCDEFLAQKVKDGAAKEAGTTKEADTKVRIWGIEFP